MLLVGAVELVVIGIAGLLTAMLSAVAGLGGGVILLAVLAQFFAPAVAIPIHGGIQLVANGSRAGFLLPDVSWPAVWRASLLLLPASFLGVAVATSIPEDAGRLVLAFFALVVAWRPSLLKWRGDDLPLNAMVPVGALSGFLSGTIGVSGPVTSPMFRAVTASHVAFVATAAASQVFAHAAKLLAFTVDGWDIRPHMSVIGVGVASVVFGSRLGTRLMGRVSEDRLGLVFKVVLTALAIRIVVAALV